jgi:hypothetical protein
LVSYPKIWRHLNPSVEQLAVEWLPSSPGWGSWPESLEKEINMVKSFGKRCGYEIDTIFVAAIKFTPVT